VRTLVSFVKRLGKRIVFNVPDKWSRIGKGATEKTTCLRHVLGMRGRRWRWLVLAFGLHLGKSALRQP